MKERNNSIDILKFLAVLLIINSHADILYPDSLKFLATGGAIGDCLFLFISGFTLSMRNSDTFVDWYKRRINRIYPSVFTCAFISAIILQHNYISMHQLFGGEFIVAIMTYYILLYGINLYASDKVYVILGLVIAVTVMVYLIGYPYKYEIGKGIYSTATLFRWIPYFAFMLLGAIVGKKRTQKNLAVKSGYIDIGLLLLSVLLFYGIQQLGASFPSLNSWQIITIFPLIGVIFYLYKACNMAIILRVYNIPIVKKAILAIGGICLESYLIQFSLFREDFNAILCFPLNLILTVIIILIVAYVCRCLARFFSQTFSSGPYNWYDIVKLY